MLQILEVTARLAVLAFVVSSMLSMGVSLTVGQILKPMRRVRLVILALVANFILAPFTAYLITLAIPIAEPLATGLILLGTAAGAPFLPRLAQLANGNLAFAVALTVLLLVVTVAYVPVVLPFLLPGVQVSPWAIARSILLLMIIPLAAGLLLQARFEVLAARLRPIVGLVSNISLILVLLLILVLYFEKVLQVIGSGAILAGVLFILVLLVLGYALGGPGGDTRTVLSLGTSQRNIPAALVIAVQNFNDSHVVVMLLVVTLVGVAISIPLAVAFGKHRDGIP
jgi:BASS family bile acid:Na+ symporter